MVVVQRHFIIYVISAIMFVTSIIYFYNAYQDYTQLLQSSSPPSSSKDESDIIETRNERHFLS
jgi:hypothetical protein